MLFKLIEDSNIITQSNNFDIVLYQFLMTIKKYINFIKINNFIYNNDITYNTYILIEYNLSPYNLEYGKIIFNKDLILIKNGIKTIIDFNSYTKNEINIKLFNEIKNINELMKKKLNKDELNKEKLDEKELNKEKLDEKELTKEKLDEKEIKEREIIDINFNKQSDKINKYLLDKKIFLNISKTNHEIPLLFNVQYNIMEYMYNNNLFSDNDKNDFKIYLLLEKIVYHIYDNEEEQYIPEEYSDICENFILTISDKQIITNNMINKISKTDNIICSMFDYK